MSPWQGLILLDVVNDLSSELVAIQDITGLSDDKAGYALRLDNAGTYLYQSVDKGELMLI